MSSSKPRTASSSSAPPDARAELLVGDSLLLVRERVPDNSLDAICTDPPYKSLEKHRKSGTTTRLKKSKASSNVWFPVIEDAVLIEHAVEWLRVLKPGRHLYVFCDPETSYSIVPQMLAAGWQWGNRLIWNKGVIGMGYHYRRKYEDILFFTKKPKGTQKKRKLRNLGMADVLDKPKYKRLKGKGVYPTEKPVPLLRDILHQSLEPGELVMDPFMGSGSCGEAALQLGCRFLGLDVMPEAVQLASDRLRALQRPLEALPVPAAVPPPPWATPKARQTV